MMKTLITGGSSGIGAALVRRLAQEGHEVTFTFCHHENKASSVAGDSRARYVHYDQTAPDSVAALARRIREAEFDFVVNNACQPAQRQLLSKIDGEAFIAYQAAAVRGVLELSQAFAEQVRRRGASGAIVNVLTSYTLGMPPAKLAMYVTTKHALLGLTRSMAVEFIRYGIRVNAVSPAMTRTAFLAGLPEQFLEQVEATLPIERLATAAEVAAVIHFLLSAEASYINGANIPVSGGQAC
jgi:NAD(P)-dependent dehydrogenase (short-subunit alcohol dehydrogenase family)